MTIFLFIFSLIFVVFWWLTRQGIKRAVFIPFSIEKKWIYLFDVIYVSLLMVSVLYRYQNGPINPLVTYVLRVHYLLMGVIWLFILLTTFSHLWTKAKNGVKKRTKKEDHFNPERRLFLQKKLALGSLGLIGISAGGGWYQAINPKIEKIDIPLADEFKSLAGLKIAQLSDIHIGPTLKADFLEGIVAQANSFNPDIIALTGDLVDGKVSVLESELGALKKLKARLGVYFITGNHEYYWNVSEWTEFVRKQGITVLENEHQILKYNNTEFALGGVTDLKASRFGAEHASSPRAAIKGVPSGLYNILLAHQPQSCHDAQASGWNLQLSGHTHGGQGMPWNLLVGLVQPYLKGLYKHKTMDLYVNRGTGYWGPPYRLGIPGEISHITLV